MPIYKGYSRTVITLPRLGLAMKFPVIRIKSAISTAGHYLTNNWHGFFRELSWTVDNMGSIRAALLRGIRDNWYEFLISMGYGYREKIFLTTYFSLFGIVNIQKLGTPLIMKNYNLRDHMIELTKKESLKDGHHFIEASNFSFENGVLTIMDYGSPRTTKICLNHGRNMQKNFNPNFDVFAKSKHKDASS